MLGQPITASGDPRLIVCRIGQGQCADGRGRGKRGRRKPPFPVPLGPHLRRGAGPRPAVALRTPSRVEAGMVIVTLRAFMTLQSAEDGDYPIEVLQGRIVIPGQTQGPVDRSRRHAHRRQHMAWRGTNRRAGRAVRDRRHGGQGLDGIVGVDARERKVDDVRKVNWGSPWICGKTHSSAASKR